MEAPPPKALTGFYCSISMGESKCQESVAHQASRIPMRPTLPPPSQLPLRHHPAIPVIPQSGYLFELLRRQLQQGEPLDHPVEADPVAISELLTGEVIPVLFDRKLACEDDRVAVGAFRGCRGWKIRSSYPDDE